MVKYLGPLQGLIVGLCLIIFKEKISLLFQKAFEKFPKFEDGVNSLNMNLEVRSVHVMIIGLIFIAISIAGFWKLLV